MRHRSAPRWVIYLLHNQQDEPDYVGATRNLPRRLREHTRTRGYRPRAVVLEEGAGRWTEAELKWIAHYDALGVRLANRVRGGNGCYAHGPETRALISSQQKGRRKPAGFGERLSIVTRGQPRGWSKEGRQRVEATQFKPGQKPSAKAKRESLKANRRYWEGIPPGERSRMAAERNVAAWREATPEQREARCRAMSEGHRAKRTPEQRSELARAAAKAAWSRLTDEERAEKVRRLSEASQARRKVQNWHGGKRAAS